MAPVKIYGAAMSTCTARAMIALEETGAEYELVPIDFATGEHKSPAHMARNPFGVVPAFQDGDLVLFESRAIAKYVARKYKSSGTDLLRDGNPHEQAMVEVWTEVESQQYNPPISTIVTQVVFMPMMGAPTDQKVVDENVAKLEKVLDVYEARLSKSKYLAGDFISLADLNHFSFAHYFTACTPYGKIFDSRPHVKAWWESLKSRASCKKISAGMPTGK